LFHDRGAGVGAGATSKESGRVRGSIASAAFFAAHTPLSRISASSRSEISSEMRIIQNLIE
jgi:hypothetical protein